MKRLEELTREELGTVISLKIEMLVEEDDENGTEDNYEDVCTFISCMQKFDDRLDSDIYRNAVGRGFDYYGRDMQEFADDAGISKAELFCCLDTIDVDEYLEE